MSKKKDLQFNFDVSKFFQEKLKLIYMQKYMGPETEGGSEDNELTLSSYHCPNCKDKLKKVDIPLKEGETLCTHCQNIHICKIADSIAYASEVLEMMEYLCPFFMPANRYL